MLVSIFMCSRGLPPARSRSAAPLRGAALRRATPTRRLARWGPRRLARAAGAFLLLAFGISPPAEAWSFDVHRRLVEQAIPLLPGEIRPFFDRYRAFITEHSIDPDLWRNAGFLEEPPRHFLDLDAYGPYPFSDLPRDYEAAVKRFGKEMVDKNGLLPWRTAEMYGRLVKAFRQHADGTSSFAGEEIKFYAAVIAHYTGDAHVPFHAALNYDGQLTNQHGIHARFEGELMRRFASRVTVLPKAATPIREPRDAIFEALLSGYPLVDSILTVDRKAVVGREEYDDQYFELFFAGTREVLERRLGEAASAIAAMIAGAWETAGRPAVPLEGPRLNRKVGKAKG